VLAELLRAEGDEQAQLAALRQATYVVRHAVDAAIIRTQGSELCLNDGLVSADVRCFERAVARCDRDSLAEAVALYRGPFLAGERSPSPAFEDWLMARRGELLEKATDALLQLARSDEAVGRHGSALVHARHALTLDSLREDAHRQVMRSLAATGQRSAALRHYEAARQALAEELSVTPDSATVSLRDVIARGTDQSENGSGYVALPARHEAEQACALPIAASGALRDTSSLRVGSRGDGTVHLTRAAARVALPLAALLILLGGSLWWLTRAEPRHTVPIALLEDSAWADRTDVPPTAPAPRLSIVVLPFTDLRDGSGEDWFAEGMTVDLTTDLSRIDGSFVIASHTAFTYKDRHGVDVREVGRELGVRYVLEGSVGRAGEWVHTNARLIDAASGAQLWAERFEGARDDLPALHNEVTSRIAATLRLELIEAEGRRVERDERPDPAAQDDAVRGWAILYRPYSRERREKARRLFELAIAKDANTVSALVGLAHVLQERSDRPIEDRERAIELLRRALDLEPNRALTHFVLGLVRRSQGRFQESVEALQTAITLDRNFARAYLQLGWTRTFMGRPDEAITLAQRSLRLNPRDPNLYELWFVIGHANCLLGQQDEAIANLERARAANPRLWYVHWTLAAAYGLAGRTAEAKHALAEHLRLRPEFNSVAVMRAHIPTGSHPAYRELEQRTILVGLRRIGFPDT
jgi:TolB-like protein/DNA-binding SARP family transcriptional activator/cytochrome c-type biogenesis protein CcmH/NrfG